MTPPPPLTRDPDPSLPGAGTRLAQARLAANGRVSDVAGAATVVMVVVKTVARSWPETAAARIRRRRDRRS